MGLPRNSLPRFVVSVLLLLAGTLVLWWGVRDDLLVTFLWLVDRASQGVLAGQVIGIRSGAAGQWQVLTSFSPLHNPLEFKTVALDPVRYTVGLPLLWALVVATPGARRLKNLLTGSILLAGIIILMLLGETLFQLLLIVGPRPVLQGGMLEEYLLALPYSRAAAYGIALGRQFALIITPVAPIVIWAMLNGSFFREVIARNALLRFQQAAGSN